MTAEVIPAPTAIHTFASKVLVVMPWQKIVCPATAFCVAQLCDRRRTATALHYGDAFVVHSRNSCVDVFLKSPLEWMLTVDDDMLIPFGHAEWFAKKSGLVLPEKLMRLNALDRLMSHRKTLVGALYYGRSADAPAMYNEGIRPEEKEFLKRGPHDAIKPTRWVGTGCMLIHRRVFIAIEEKFPALSRAKNNGSGQWFTSTEASLLDAVTRLKDSLQGQPLTGELAYKAIAGLEAMAAMARHENPLGTGEDVAFCLRAAAAGHQPYVDLGLRCGHIGYHVY
jgi:hypothetical protein